MEDIQLVTCTPYMATNNAKQNQKKKKKGKRDGMESDVKLERLGKKFSRISLLCRNLLILTKNSKNKKKPKCIQPSDINAYQISQKELRERERKKSQNRGLNQDEMQIFLKGINASK